MFKSTNQMVSNRQKKKRLAMRTFVMTLLMALFTQFAQAQNVYMHGGTQTVPATGSLNFYDSGGPSSADYWWEKWYSHNENATLTFKKDASTPVSVTFNQFTAYDGNTGANIGQYSLRINDDHLYVYDGDREDASKLIVDLTGTIKESFTIMAEGPITFKFVSNGSYREEGWAAQVSAASSYAMQKPIIVKEICDDEVVLYPTAPGATIYYTTDGSNPTTSSTEYTGPFSIDLSDNVTVKAIVVKDGQNNSAVATHTFTPADQRPTPTTPNISIDGNMVHITPGTVPAGLNETYNVRYTADGTEPSATNGTLLTSPWDAFEWHTPNTTFKAVSVAVTCDQKISSVVSEHFGDVTVPTPVITFNSNGTATITCSLTGATIYYTIDGTTPTVSNSTPHAVTPATTEVLAIGTTVNAIAHYGSPGYVDSDMASNTYVPEGGSTVGGGVVLLDDREDHSWSYYSDATNPIRSLNPADVKITYYGNGTGTISTTNSATPASNSWTENATGVQISNTETENQFIYLKTLERADGSTSDSPTGRCEYTTIANPFSKRPTYQYASGNNNKYCGFYGWRIKAIRGGKVYNANGTQCTAYTSGNVTTTNYLYAESQCYFEPDAETGMEVELEALWARAYVTTSTSTSGLQASVGYERNFMVLGSNPSSQTQTVTIGNSVNTTTNGANLPLTNYYNYSLTQQIYTPSEIGYEGRITSLAFRYSSNSNITRNIDIYLMHTTESTLNGTYGVIMTNSVKVYSGSYRFTSGWNTITLTTPFDYDGTSNLIVAVDDNTGTNGTNRYFYTYSTGTARARYWRSDSQNYTGTAGYEGGTTSNYNPQIRFTVNTNTNGNSLNNITVPCTVMACNPDGTNQSSTVMVSGNIRCGADLKIEHVKMSGSESSSLNGNGHSLIIGRGVTPGTSGFCAGNVYGYLLSSAPTSAINFKLRMESGVFNNVYGMYGSSTSLASATTNVGITFGSDYDRAVGGTTGNGKFEIAGTYSLTFSVSGGTATSKFITNVFSGTYTCATDEFYMGYWNSDGMKSIRYNTIYGGDFVNGLTLGIDQSANANTITGFLRIYGGNFQEQLYATGQYAEATGSRRIVITGGTFGDWIAAGCYGTNPSGGYLNGNVALYFGGKAKQTSNAGLFGSGYGTAEVYGTADENSYYVNASTVVVADQAQVAGSVYGGGNNGFAQNSSDVHILGGTISGNVFGGANKSKGATITVNVKGGTIAGNVYGGSDTKGVISELATVNVSDGTVNNVFGGGLGTDTDMANGTKVNITGGTINNNVYGGGEQGTVSNGGTEVNVSGGTMKDVYGAGKGASSITALVSGQTKVTVSGGTISGDVFGGGQNGNVAFTDSSSPSTGETTTYDFDNSTSQGWTSIDADGDGFDWVLGSNIGGVYLVTGASLAGSGHNSSNDMMCSGSYRNISSNQGAVLYPNNYLVSPQISLGGSITFYASAQDADYPAEHFGVAVSTTSNNDPSAFTTIQEWTLTAKSGGASVNPVTTRGGNRDQGAWYQYTVDLSSYSGQGYVAIRHFDCSDKFILNIDDITITEPANGEAPEVVPASLVKVSGGAISGSVFGGGKMGTTTGAVTTTVSGGNIRGNVFGGAEGEQKKVFVTGLRTVNMTGGHVYGNVYGGSRNANDGNDLNLAHSSFESSTETSTICVTNISGGSIDQNVYAAGYYGNTFGSVYAFIGKNAIENAPNKRPTSEANYAVSNLNILGTVWAGGDWGTFSGSFGGPTISGNSNIYIDGLDYQTTTTQTSNAQYMNIGGSVLASGTSCDAGKGERTVIIRNYGTANNNGSKEEPYIDASRSLLSIQRAKLLIIDNANLNLNGQGIINSLNATEKYGIYEIGNGAVTEDMKYGVRLVNGAGLFLNAPVSQIANFVSCSCDDVYTAELTTDDYPALTPSDLSTTDNKVRVNGGNYVEVKYGTQYGMLSGYAHMMVSTADTDATCAYARPRWESNAPFNMNDPNYDNRNDGGWVSYTASNNTFDLAGNSGSIQMPYENHTHATKNGEQYFRIWRAGGIEHYREGVFNAHATGSDTYKTVDVTITLPALRDRNYVYRFETVGTGTNTSINYGADIMTYDAARATGSGDDWISYTTSQQGGQTQTQVQTLLNEGILANPDVNFGLVVMPSTGLGLTGGTYLISQNADENLALATTQFTNANFTMEDQITFRLTYYDKLSSNMTWDPMTIVLVQVDPAHPDIVLDRVTISLAVNTSTTITQEFSTTLYAVMQGKGSNSESYTAKVTLPHFTVVSGQESTFTVNSVVFTPNEIDNDNDQVTDETGRLVNRGGTYTRTDFAVTYGASNNYDNTNGWASNTGQDHDANQTSNVEIGKTGGRNEFAIDFTLHYNGHESITTTDTLGVLTFNITFDYFVDENDETQMNQPMTILVYVIRRGGGTKFYLDGINGSNNFDGKHPDQAALSLSTIFNRLGYLAGDEIYIVNKVTIDKQLTWNGSTYDNVLIYRYDGGHELATSTGIIGNPDNEAYLDTLVYVTHNLVMTGITLDGHYNGGNTQIQVGVDNNNQPVYAPFTPVTAESPMIVIANGATVELNEGTVLRQNNNNASDGGAVYIADGGTLMMNADATITNNVSVGNGAGVYMDGTLNVSDDVVIYDNISKGLQNNVYLTDPDKVVTIGTGSTTDAYGALSSSAQIGVTKTTSSEYTKVVHVDSENDIAWLETPYPRPNTVIFHDDGIYELEYYEDPTYLYWVGTWVTTVTWNPYFTSREQTGYTDYMTADQLLDIHTPQQLAWVISMLNGENHCVAGANSNANIKVTADIDMYASIWVPMGTTAHPFTGTFDGNGFTIEGIHSTLVHQDMGMFGNTAGTVSNAVIKVDFDANSANIGSVAGTVSGGTISNVEAAGTLTGGSNTVNMGGIAGVTASGSEVHSSFSVNTMSSKESTTVMGGLVGTNGGDLINSYANAAMSVSEHIGGLAGDNTGRIENCYSVVGIKNFPSFAYNNSGTITYCYADKAGNYVTAGQTEPTKSGNYTPALDRKALGYMYFDNKVTATNNGYVLTDHAYDANHIVKWDGLLSVLNQWVNDGHTSYTKWFRPTTKNINSDLPVLGFPKSISMATENSDGKFLDYSNNLDHLLESYGGKTASIFLYESATGVENVPGTNLFVYVNEDAALIQAEGAGEFKNTIVGVTFDNNKRSGNATGGEYTPLNYDWHMMSSPLKAAPMGTQYGSQALYGEKANISTMEGNYMPNGLLDQDIVYWDLYCYYEPQYHWINLKRGSDSHWHYDEPHDQISYTNESIFTPGKGYMMAISQDSYLNNTGTLNNADVTIPLTCSGNVETDVEPTKDWGCNLVGNPYQAYLDLNLVAQDSDNDYDMFYIYSAEQNQYVPFKLGSSKNTWTPSQYIHPHQAFFVRTDANDNKFTIKYTMATATKDSDSYFRKGDHIDYPLINLAVENNEGGRNYTIIEVGRPELGGAEKTEALRTTDFDLYARYDQKDYKLLFTPAEANRVAVFFTAKTDGTYTITWETQNGEFSFLRLIDNITGVECDMTRTDHYTFEGHATDFASRFYILFNNPNEEPGGNGNGNGYDNNFAYYDGHGWIINGEGILQLVDVTGRVLYREYLAGDMNRVHLDNFKAGVYVLQLGDKAQKIIIK